MKKYFRRFFFESKSKQLNGPKNHGNFIFLGISVLLLFFVFVFFIFRAYEGLSLFQFGDESEKFVAAQMMNEGLHLYKDIFAHHGLLPYVFVYTYTQLISATDFSFVRSINVLLAFFSIISVFLSPIHKNLQEKTWTTIFYLSMLSSVWLAHDLHLVYYHSIGGLLFVFPVMFLALPALMGENVSKAGAFFSAVTIVLLCFTSYSFGITALLLIFSTLLSLIVSRKINTQLVVTFISGILLTLLFIIIWLHEFGDIKGYFVYHFYFNQSVYSEFSTTTSLINVFNNFKISTDSNKIVHSISVILMAVWAFMLFSVMSRKKSNTTLIRSIALVLLIFSLLMLNPRGDFTLRDGSFVIGNIALFAVTINLIVKKWRSEVTKSLFLILTFVIIFSTMEMLSGISTSLVHNVQRKFYNQSKIELKPSYEEPFVFIRDITQDNERILSLVFRPFFYIEANRLPASGNFYYLPWQAAYIRKPIMGYSINICDDINKNKPSVIWNDNWKVWGLYSLDKYEPCIPDILNKDYTQVSKNLFVRSPLAYDIGLADVNQFKLTQTQTVSEQSSIHLSFTNTYMEQEEYLVQLGILFSPEASERLGEVELHLINESGGDIKNIIKLSDIDENKYFFVNLQPDRYFSGRIVSINGSDFSLLESFAVGSEKYTCLIYEFSGGNFLFTPGCPLNY